ncbi:MAG: HEAT repeat protein, partial [Pirellulaceae bacterium]
TRTIDFERDGDFYLGPTGAKGWIYTARNFMTTDARQILITQVEPGSAAEGVLAVGDVILGVGVGDKYFTSDARMSFGRAIDEAERDENRGVLKLIRWRPVNDATARKGTETQVELKLKVMGAYSDTAPWDCPKTKRIRDDAIQAIIESKDMGRLGATALALLATGEKEYVEIVRQYLHSEKWAAPDVKISVEKGGLQSWFCGYHNLLLTEYYLATGDEYVLPAIREHSIKTAMGQSNAGTWGHGFAWTSQNGGKLHGALPGYGALNQAGLPCFLSLLLAKKCGVEHPEVDAAILRSSRFFEQFIDNGSIGYGFHRPSLEIYANGRNGMSGNGKNGIGAIVFRVQGNEEGTRFFSRLTASLYNTCEYGHSGNSYSYFWDPIGANCGGPKLAAAFLKEMRWYYALTRKADGSFVNQPLGGHYGGQLLSPTAAQVLIASLPRKAIYLTGKGQKENEWHKDKEIQETIASGRWRLADTDEMSVDQLIKSLDNWSPIAREWIARKLAAKEGDFVPRLVRQLEAERPEARAGACAALGYLGERAAAAVPNLAKALTDKESIVCISAGYALARLGKSSRQAVPDLLRAMLDSTETELMKPRQQALAYSFGYANGRYAPLYFDGLLPQFQEDENPLDGVDRELLYSAITKLLNDSSGRTRGSAAYALNYFSRQDTAAMAQQIHNAITTVALNYRMMDDGVRARGLDLMARFRIEEGIPLCFETFDFHRWGSVMRVPARLKTLQAYAGNAKPFLPQLRELRTRWSDGENRDMLEETIKIIEQDENPPPMISLHDLVDERLENDLSSAENDKERVDLCRQLMAEWPDDYFYQAAALRKISAIRGSEAFDDLLIAIAVPNEILHQTSVALAAELPAAKTKQWVDLLANAQGRKLAGILDVLALRRDAAALKAISEYLQHEDPVVVEAAKRAVSKLTETEKK